MIEAKMTDDGLEPLIQKVSGPARERALLRGMDRGTKMIEGMVLKQRLTGKGPFPVSQHRLGVKTGRLRQGLRSTRARVDGGDIVTSIGNNVRYARVHEFGFSGKVAVPAHQRTIRMAWGKRLQAPKSIAVRAHQRAMKAAERAPIRTGIKQHFATLARELSREFIKLTLPSNSPQA